MVMHQHGRSANYAISLIMPGRNLISLFPKKKYYKMKNYGKSIISIQDFTRIVIVLFGI